MISPFPFITPLLFSLTPLYASCLHPNKEMNSALGRLPGLAAGGALLAAPRAPRAAGSSRCTPSGLGARRCRALRGSVVLLGALPGAMGRSPRTLPHLARGAHASGGCSEASQSPGTSSGFAWLVAVFLWDFRKPLLRHPPTALLMQPCSGHPTATCQGCCCRVCTAFRNVPRSVWAMPPRDKAPTYLSTKNSKARTRRLWKIYLA